MGIIGFTTLSNSEMNQSVAQTVIAAGAIITTPVKK